MIANRIIAAAAVMVIAALSGGDHLLAGDSRITSVSVPSPASDSFMTVKDAAALKRKPTEKGGFLPNLGNYFDEASPGWGLDIQAVGNLLFAVWFTYLPDGSPTWYIIVGELTAKGDGMSLTGDIDSFKWDPSGTRGDQATATTVGTMTIDWIDESNANVSWTLDGDPGNAVISFAAFAPGLAFANLTGHYFSFFAPGWGFTLLTQGDITVLTLYWYKNGQPVWAQGVTPVPGFNQLISLLLFNGPNLCPSCLEKQGEKGFTTQELTDVTVNYTPDVPPDTLIAWPGRFSKGGPLGSNPFEDIPLDSSFVTASAITSAYGNNYDPTYADFGALIAGLDLGTNCLAFEYNDGVWDATIAPTFSTAYFLLAPTPEGGLPVYADAKCTEPFLLKGVFGSVQTQIMGAGTGSDDDKGAVTTDPLQITWGATFVDVFRNEKGFCSVYDRVTTSGVRWAGPGALTIRLYGVTRGDTISCDDGFTDYAPFGGWVNPPLGVDIASAVDDGLTFIMTY